MIAFYIHYTLFFVVYFACFVLKRRQLRSHSFMIDVTCILYRCTVLSWVLGVPDEYMFYLPVMIYEDFGLVCFRQENKYI